MPEDAIRAHQAITAHTRLLVIRYLLHEPNSAKGAIIEGTGLSRNTVRAALDDLEETGFLLTSAEPGRRQGRPVEYRINRAEMTRSLATLWAYIVG